LIEVSPEMRQIQKERLSARLADGHVAGTAHDIPLYWHEDFAECTLDGKYLLVSLIMSV
jgi:hypothetical protein